MKFRILICFISLSCQLPISCTDIVSSQFSSYTQVKCEGSAVCLNSKPDKSVNVISQGNCVLECNRQQSEGPNKCVGVNYRQPSKVCEIFFNVTDDTLFANNIPGCQYSQVGRPSILSVCSQVDRPSMLSVLTDVNECLTNNGGCSVDAQCNNTRGSFLCTCNAEFTGNGLVCTANLVACETTASSVTIMCPSNSTIAIVNANYGRTSPITCPSAYVSNTNCRASTSLSYVMQQCQAKSSCSVQASYLLFGDPCYGTSKYLNVTYYCA